MERKTKIVLLLGLMITITAAVVLFIAASESGNSKQKYIPPTKSVYRPKPKPYKPKKKPSPTTKRETTTMTTTITLMTTRQSSTVQIK